MSEPVDAARRRTLRRWRAIALLWGFAEATLFFVIPDVWITRVATPRIGQRAVLAAWLGLWTVGYTLYWLRMPN